MRSLSRHRLLAAILVATSLLSITCGENELDLGEYLLRFKDINDAAFARIDTLTEESQGVTEDVDATRDYVNNIQEVIKQALNDLNDLHPPAEARDAHDEFTAGLSEMLAAWENLRDRLADLESPSELRSLLAEPGNEAPFEAASQRLDGACLQLQEMADENSIDIDLQCE